MARVDSQTLPIAPRFEVEIDTEAEGGATRTLTLLDLVAAVAESAETDAEVIATIEHLLASGRVRLVGQFRNRDLEPDRD